MCLADRRGDVCFTLFCKIVNDKVYVPSEGIIILAKGTIRKCQAQTKCVHVTNIDGYQYVVYP